jgi:hypothetical protein
MYRCGFTIALVAIVAAGATCAQAIVRVGEATTVERDVFGSQIGQERRKVLEGDDVYENDLIRTETASSARILFVDETDVNIGPAAALKLDRFVFNPDQSVRSLTVIANEGAIRWISGHSVSKAYEIKTPTALVRVHGTVFDLFVEQSRTTVLMREGVIEVCVVNAPDHCRTVSESGDLVVVTSSAIEGPRQGGPDASEFAALCLSAASSRCVLADTIDPSPKPSRRAAIGKPEQGRATNRSSARGGSVADPLAEPPKRAIPPPSLGYNPPPPPPTGGSGDQTATSVLDIATALLSLAPYATGSSPLPPAPSPPQPPTGGGWGTPRPPTGVGAGAPQPPTGGGVGTPQPPTGVGVGTPQPPTGVGVGTPQPPTSAGVGTPRPPTGVGVGTSDTSSPLRLNRLNSPSQILKNKPLIMPRNPLSGLAVRNLPTTSQGTGAGADIRPRPNQLTHSPSYTLSGNQTKSPVNTSQSVRSGRIQRVHNEPSSGTGRAFTSPNLRPGHIQRVHNASSDNGHPEFSRGRAQYNSGTPSPLHGTRNHANVSAGRAFPLGGYQRRGPYASSASPFRPNYIRPAPSFLTGRAPLGFAQHQYHFRR